MAGEVRLPTREEIATLPQWARVALAVRCAMRAQPLFVLGWPKAPRDHVEEVERAIAAAACLTAGDSSNLGAMTRIKFRVAVADSNSAAAANAVAAATAAANAAANATTSAAVYAAAAASADAADAASELAGPIGRAMMVEAIARDFRDLQTATIEGRWTNETHVDPRSSGPLGDLWSHSNPTLAPDWKALAAEHRASKSDIQLPTTTAKEVPKRGRILGNLDLYIQATDEDEEDIADLLIALSDMHRAAGGLGLTFEGRETRVAAACEVPA